MPFRKLVSNYNASDHQILISAKYNLSRNKKQFWNGDFKTTSDYLFANKGTTTF